MFARKLRIERLDVDGGIHPIPVAHIDSFAMRNFTNDAIFDDALPVADSLLEIGHRVPVDRLREAMQEWLQRKSYIKSGESLRITEL